MQKAVFDDMGRKLMVPGTLTRIVSLVPSDTETLFALGAGSKVVGRTRYCVEPAGAIEAVPSVGGTKDIDVDAVMALSPELVIANQEENSRANLEALAARGARVFVAFPKRFADAIAHVARLAKLVGVSEEAKEILRAGYALSSETPAQVAPVRVFVPIWRDPLMTFSEHTYAGDLLRMAGAENVFSDRLRQYPLKADLGLRSPLSADQVGNRDRRYPRITESELCLRAPELILLPDEPYEFSEADKAYFASLDVPAAASGKLHFVCGKDLFWPGSRSVQALTRLRHLIADLR